MRTSRRLHVFEQFYYQIYPQSQSQSQFDYWRLSAGNSAKHLIPIRRVVPQILQNIINLDMSIRPVIPFDNRSKNHSIQLNRGLKTSCHSCCWWGYSTQQPQWQGVFGAWFPKNFCTADHLNIWKLIYTPPPKKNKLYCPKSAFEILFCNFFFEEKDFFGPFWALLKVSEQFCALFVNFLGTLLKGTFIHQSYISHISVIYQSQESSKNEKIMTDFAHFPRPGQSDPYITNIHLYQYIQ